MSAGINENERLFEYLEGLYNGSRSRERYDQYQEDLNNATAWSVNSAIDRLILKYDDYDRIEESVARFIRAASKGLEQNNPAPIPEDHFLGLLMKENMALQELRQKLTLHFKYFTNQISQTGQKAADDPSRRLLLETLLALQEIRSHYLKIQYILFSAFEDCSQEFRCVKLMWHIQDEIMDGLKHLIHFLEREDSLDLKEFNRIYGEMFLKMGALLYREEKILFPVAYRAIPEDRFKHMKTDISEYGAAFSVALPSELSARGVLKDEITPESPAGSGIDLSVGSLLPSQIDLMLKNLPFDITFVDENDRVRYYSQGKERIFPRSPGIIGRDVGNCHPPKSVHVVQKIVEDFKAKKRKDAEFWIPMGEKFVHIRYFPLFDEGDIYRGVIEVSQDIAPLRALEGSKRLLDD